MYLLIACRSHINCSSTCLFSWMAQTVRLSLSLCLPGSCLWCNEVVDILSMLLSHSLPLVLYKQGSLIWKLIPTWISCRAYESIPRRTLNHVLHGSKQLDFHDSYHQFLGFQSCKHNSWRSMYTVGLRRGCLVKAAAQSLLLF